MWNMLMIRQGRAPSADSDWICSCWADDEPPRQHRHSYKLETISTVAGCADRVKRHCCSFDEKLTYANVTIHSREKVHHTWISNTDSVLIQSMLSVLHRLLQQHSCTRIITATKIVSRNLVCLSNTRSFCFQFACQRERLLQLLNMHEKYILNSLYVDIHLVRLYSLEKQIGIRAIKSE